MAGWTIIRVREHWNIWVFLLLADRIMFWVAVRDIVCANFGILDFLGERFSLGRVVRRLGEETFIKSYNI